MGEIEKSFSTFVSWIVRACVWIGENRGRDEEWSTKKKIGNISAANMEK